MAKKSKPTDPHPLVRSKRCPVLKRYFDGGTQFLSMACYVQKGLPSYWVLVKGFGPFVVFIRRKFKRPLPKTLVLEHCMTNGGELLSGDRWAWWSRPSDKRVMALIRKFIANDYKN